MLKEKADDCKINWRQEEHKSFVYVTFNGDAKSAQLLYKDIYNLWRTFPDVKFLSWYSIDVEKFEKYADECAEEFNKNVEENGEAFALKE